MPRTETAPEQLAAGQMVQLERQYQQAKQKLESWQQETTQLKADLADLDNRRQKAEKLLALTENILGCQSERELAERALEKCADQRPRLEQRLESNRLEVRRQERALKAIDVTAFAPLAKIRALSIGL